MDVAAHEAMVLDLLDGRDLGAVVRAAVDLGVRPMQVLALLRRLDDASLLEGVGPEASHLFGRRRPSLTGRLFRRLGDLHLLLPFLAAPLAAGRLIPAAVWKRFHLVGFLLLAAVWCVAAVYGGLPQLTNPLPTTDAPLTLLALLYASAALVLSIRGLARGLAMRSLGVAVPGAGLRLTWGVLHIEADQRHRGSASRDRRIHLALVGLSSLAWVAALCAAAYVTTQSGVARLVSVVATLALVANLSPYGRTDAWHLAGMLTRIPSLRRRALHFLVRQVGRNLRKRAPTTPDERRYLLLVTLWLLHALLVLALVGERLLPGATGLLGATISGTGVAHFEASLVVTGLLVGVVAVAGALYAAALAGLVGAFLVQLLRTRPPVVRRGDAGEAETRAFLAGADGVPFLAGLDATARGMVAFALRREAHPPESAVITQGTVGDRFCFLLSGHCRVEVCEASGIVHDVAHLGPGAFFGEVALLEGRPRTATVRAMDEVVVLTLEREAFDHILDESDLPRDRCVEDLRVAALLREIPPLRELSPPELDQLQRGLVSEARGAGEVILREGDPGDAMYLLREGRCRVIRDGDLLAELGPGDYFGELALIATGSRTASVVAANDVSLLRLPAELFHSVLLANFEAALRLDEGCADRLDALQGR